MAVKIPLTHGFEATIDECDIALVSLHKWRAKIQYRVDGTFRVYARRNTYANGKRGHEQLHRAIMDPPAGTEVDHIDGDCLNNTRSNLRIVTRNQNQHNSRAQTVCNGKPVSSHYKGVCWDKRSHKWKAKISYLDFHYGLGRFELEDDAAKAYNSAAIEIFGQYARVNRV